MLKLSTGDDSTLANYRKLAVTVFGEKSNAVGYIDKKIAESSPDEPVLADERQMVALLVSLG